MARETGVIVRRAVVDDLGGVLGVLAEGQASAPLGPPRPPPLPTELQRDTWTRMLAIPDMLLYLADRRGKAVGTATMLLMPHLT